MKSCIEYHIQQDEKEHCDMQQMCQTEGTQKHNGKKHSVTVNTPTLAEGNELEGYPFFRKIMFI